MTLRPPRVALLFFAGSSWREWARLAIATASRHWGGEGFIYVPYDGNGHVPDSLLPLVSAYDPDYIAVLANDASTWLRLSPEIMKRFRKKGEHSTAFVARMSDLKGPIPDNLGDAAGRALQAVCTLLGDGGDDVAGRVNFRISSDDVDDQSPFLRAPRTGQVVPTSFLAADRDWDGDVALSAAARTGYAPQTGAIRAEPDSERLLRWVLSPTAENTPVELATASSRAEPDMPARQRRWFEVASPDVGRFTAGASAVAGAVVVGDQASDFAAAVIYDRILGYGIWLSSMVIGSHFVNNWRLSYFLKSTLDHVGSWQAVALVSTSLSGTEVDKIAIDLLPDVSAATRNGQPVDSPEDETLTRATPTMRHGLGFLGMIDHVGEDVTVPVVEREDGTITLQAPIAAPVPISAGLPLPVDSFGEPKWFVDVSIYPPVMPTGRGLSSKAVLDPSERRGMTLIRSSRAGISYLAASHGFISSGTILSSRLSRPRLQQLGMFSWTQAMAAQSGLTARHSRPGQHADLISRRLGSRSRLIELATGPLLPFLQEFVSRSIGKEATARVFPEGDGVVLDSNFRYVKFDALGRLTPELAWESRRALVDELLRARLIRQGLVLDCDECGAVSFLSLDELRQRYECKRCGGPNDFQLARWKSQSAEPPWFYDLHNAFRDLLKNNGDVVLLTAAHLKSRSQLYLDTSEVQFHAKPDEKPSYEIDLIALTDDGVIVAEAKSNGQSGTTAADIQKRFRAAKALRADKVIFASSATAWPPGVRSRAQSIADTQYPEIALEFVSGLTYQPEPSRD